MPFQSTKTWGHERGLSCAFRQWRANSHCNQLHGYALAIELVFQANELDSRNWVVDFGDLGELKRTYEELFDHKTLVAFDDPMLGEFRRMAQHRMLEITEVVAVGCEAFAKLVFDEAQKWLDTEGYSPRVRLVSAKVSEHGSNSALYIGESNGN